MLPDLDIPDKWEDRVCGMDPKRFKKVAGVFAIIIMLSFLLGFYVFYYTGNVPVPPIADEPPYEVKARLRTSILIEGYEADEFRKDENPGRFRWAMSAYLNLPAEAVEVVSWGERDWSLFAAQNEWDSQLNQTALEAGDVHRTAHTGSHLYFLRQSRLQLSGGAPNKQGGSINIVREFKKKLKQKHRR